MTRAMRNTAELVQRHYEMEEGSAGHVSSIMRMLDELGDGPLTALQLAPLDQFHVLGLPATKELAELAGIEREMKVLDAGSGLGGPSRYLAEAYACHVTGVDLTPSFVDIAKLLAERTGLGDLVRYQVGDLLTLPFPDHRFDVVWTQHVVMNISDREQVYREFCRVLSPSGKLVFFDIFAADEKSEPIFPLPWADRSETSFLLTKAETIEALKQAGFARGVWNDLTERALIALGSDQALLPAPGHLSIATVMGPRFFDMLANLRRNLREG